MLTLPKHKTVGDDNIPVELILNSGNKLLNQIFRLIKTIYGGNKWPKEMNRQQYRNRGRLTFVKVTEHNQFIIYISKTTPYNKRRTGNFINTYLDEIRYGFCKKF